MINTTVSLIIGYGLLFVSELLPLLPIPQQGLLHTLILAFTNVASSVSNSVMTNPPGNALDILKDVQEGIKTIQQAIPPPPPVQLYQTPPRPIPKASFPPPVRSIPSLPIESSTSPPSTPNQPIPKATLIPPPPARPSTNQMFSGVTPSSKGEYFPKYPPHGSENNL